MKQDTFLTQMSDPLASMLDHKLSKFSTVFKERPPDILDERNDKIQSMNETELRLLLEQQQELKSNKVTDMDCDQREEQKSMGAFTKSSFIYNQFINQRNHQNFTDVDEMAEMIKIENQHEGQNKLGGTHELKKMKSVKVETVQDTPEQMSAPNSHRLTEITKGFGRRHKE